VWPANLKAGAARAITLVLAPRHRTDWQCILGLADLKRSIAFVTINLTRRYDRVNYIRSISDSTQLVVSTVLKSSAYVKCHIVFFYYSTRGRSAPIPVWVQ